MSIARGKVRAGCYICAYMTWLINVSLWQSTHESRLLIKPRRACAARVTVLGLCVCLSVCLSVYDYSRTTGYGAAYERYQQLQWYKGMKNNVAILLKRLCSRDMAWKQAKKPICVMSTGLPWPGLARSAHRGRINLLRGYVSKSSAALNPLTITQLACER